MQAPLAIDLGARIPHPSRIWPGITWILRPMPSTVALYCRDRASVRENGELQIRINEWRRLAFRFGVDSIEGFEFPVPKDVKGNKIAAPPFHVRVLVSGREYEAVSPEWMDVIHPDGILEAGTAAIETNTLSEEQKKRSAWRPGGDEAPAGETNGTAPDAA